ncbi:MAG: alpha/beta fold hydrolase [Clostridiales bacterium]|nr:alpha/beta fold hydrolase [Clostridiales bacterium]
MAQEAIVCEREGAESIVVFIHGFMGGPGQFADWLEAVYAAGYSVAALLLPGHGGSAPEFARASRADWLACVQAEVDRWAAKYEKVYLVGHSMGGLLALLASTWTVPEIAGQARNDMEKETANNAVAGVVAIAAPLKIRLALLRKLRLLLYPKGHPIATAYRQGNSITRLGPFALIRPFRELMRLMKQTKESLPQVEAPVFLAHSKYDETTNSKSAELLCEGLTNAPCETLTLGKSWHAWYETGESALITERLLAFIKNAPSQHFHADP